MRLRDSRINGSLAGKQHIEIHISLQQDGYVKTPGTENALTAWWKIPRVHCWICDTHARKHVAGFIGRCHNDVGVTVTDLPKFPRINLNLLAGLDVPHPDSTRSAVSKINV